MAETGPTLRPENDAERTARTLWDGHLGVEVVPADGRQTPWDAWELAALLPRHLSNIRRPRPRDLVATAAAHLERLGWPRGTDAPVESQVAAASVGLCVPTSQFEVATVPGWDTGTLAAAAEVLPAAVASLDQPIGDDALGVLMDAVNEGAPSLTRLVVSPLRDRDDLSDDQRVFLWGLIQD